MLSSEQMGFIELLKFLYSYVGTHQLSEREIDTLCEVMGYSSKISSLLKSLFADY